MNNALVRHLLKAGSGWFVVGILFSAFASIASQQHTVLHEQTVDQALSQLQQQPKNAAAQNLERHLSQLGLGLPEPKTLEDRHLSEEFAAIQPLLDQYLKDQRTQVTSQLAPLPEEVQTYLVRHQQTLETVQDQLLEQPLPVWTTDFAQLAHPQYQAPDFFPLARLQRLLLAKAIHGQAQPDVQTDAMAQSLEAAWQLTLTLRARPDLLSQVFANILMQQQAGLLRHLEAVPAAWHDRLKLDTQNQVLHALRFDSWIEYKTLKKQLAGEAQAQLLSNPFDKVYLQLSRSDWQRSRQQSYEALSHSESPCSVPPDKLEVSSSWWNVYGSQGAPQLGREWARAGDRQLAAELTGQVVNVKHMARSLGSWPETLEPVRSRVCPELVWQYQRTPDGGFEIGLEQLPLWRVDATHEMLPLRYQAAPLQAQAAVTRIPD